MVIKVESGANQNDWIWIDNVAKVAQFGYYDDEDLKHTLHNDDYYLTWLDRALARVAIITFKDGTSKQLCYQRRCYLMTDDGQTFENISTTPEEIQEALDKTKRTSLTPLVIE